MPKKKTNTKKKEESLEHNFWSWMHAHFSLAVLAVFLFSLIFFAFNQAHADEAGHVYDQQYAVSTGQIIPLEPQSWWETKWNVVKDYLGMNDLGKGTISIDKNGYQKYTVNYQDGTEQIMMWNADGSPFRQEIKWKDGSFRGTSYDSEGNVFVEIANAPDGYKYSYLNNPASFDYSFQVEKLPNGQSAIWKHYYSGLEHEYHKYPDGSTQEIWKFPDGHKQDIYKTPDGAAQITSTKPDGSSYHSSIGPDGQVVEVNVKDGEITGNIYNKNTAGSGKSDVGSEEYGSSDYYDGFEGGYDEMDGNSSNNSSAEGKEKEIAVGSSDPFVDIEKKMNAVAATVPEMGAENTAEQNAQVISPEAYQEAKKNGWEYYGTNAENGNLVYRDVQTGNFHEYYDGEFAAFEGGVADINPKQNAQVISPEDLNEAKNNGWDYQGTNADNGNIVYHNPKNGTFYEYFDGSFSKTESDNVVIIPKDENVEKPAGITQETAFDGVPDFTKNDYYKYESGQYAWKDNGGDWYAFDQKENEFYKVDDPTGGQKIEIVNPDPFADIEKKMNAVAATVPNDDSSGSQPAPVIAEDASENPVAEESYWSWEDFNPFGWDGGDSGAADNQNDYQFPQPSYDPGQYFEDADNSDNIPNYDLWDDYNYNPPSQGYDDGGYYNYDDSGGWEPESEEL